MALQPRPRPLGTPETEKEIQRHTTILRAAAGNAALMRHVDSVAWKSTRSGLPEEVLAAQRRGIALPPAVHGRPGLAAAIILTYHVGHDLLGAWLDPAAGLTACRCSSGS